MIIVLWLAVSILCAFVAAQKNRNAFVWFLIAIFLTPILALLALVAVPDVNIVADVTAEPVRDVTPSNKLSPYMQALLNRG
jgi:hypothetical protein